MRHSAEAPPVSRKALLILMVNPIAETKSPALQPKARTIFDEESVLVVNGQRRYKKG